MTKMNPKNGNEAKSGNTFVYQKFSQFYDSS